MDHILELTSTNQLTLPDDLIRAAGLMPGYHFEARIESNRLIIEQLPFSSDEQGCILNQTIEDLQNENQKI